MGCFSFICKESGKAVCSDSFNGDAVHLFLLHNGEVVEHMFGNYNSYGRVFDGNGGSFEWEIDWGDVCELMSDDSPKNGIAAILDRHYKGNFPITISEDDPNQGWGDNGEYFGETGNWTSVAVPFHTVHKKYDKPPEPFYDSGWDWGKELADEIAAIVSTINELQERIDRIDSGSGENEIK